MSILKAQMAQEGIRREEEHVRLEQERKDRKDEHRMEHESHKEESRRHDQLMQMTMVMISKWQITETPKITSSGV